MWSPVRDDMRLVKLTTDVGYECRIARMAWNQGFTVLAMVSCRGDLMVDCTLYFIYFIVSLICLLNEMEELNFGIL